MVTTRRMSTGITPAKRAVSPSTPTRRRSPSTSKAAAPTPATPAGSRTPRRGAAAARAGKSGKGGSGAAATDGKTRAIRLLVKAMGIYACFIYWGIVQERVTTTEYQPAPGLGGKPGRFNSMITLNGPYMRCEPALD